MKIIYSISFLLLLTLSSLVSKSQIVTTTPSFPTVNNAVTIIYDATQGNQALMGVTGDVYAHTGVITSASSSSGDWFHAPANWGDNDAKYRMTSLGNNRWQLVISPSILEYYNIRASEVVNQLAFVFRNADGTIAGKETGDQDIFVDVSQGDLNVRFDTPTHNSVVEIGASVAISINANGHENLRLLINNTEDENTTTNSISKSSTYTTAGDYQLIAIATNGSKEARDTINFVVRDANNRQSRPAELHNGINYTSTSSATLQLFAPHKENIFVFGSFNNWIMSNQYQMKKDGDYFWLAIENLTPGTEYIYQYIIDGTIKIADPYADKLLDPSNDKDIPTATYPNLIEYPSSKTSQIASVLQTGQTAFNWTDNSFSIPKKDDLVIYELHVRDFTTAGNIKTVTDTLNYLERLGVNAIELMPFNEFEGNDSWGYNPSFYFAPDKAYGTKEDYKAFINECHNRGIAVFMDMVLNHSFSQSPLVQMYFENGKPSDENPWYNTDHNFENDQAQWGYDFDHTSTQTQQLVDRINSYWMTEYHIDGFRFDFTKGFSNTYHSSSNDNWGSLYDADRVEILKRMFNKIREVKADAPIIIEHLSDNDEEKELANHGFLMWGNANGNYNEATMGWHESGKSDLRWTSWKERGWNASNLISYMESHDEERLMFKNNEYGNEAGQKPGDYSAKDLNIALSRMEAAASFYFSIPGPKMIWQFGELGYDVSIDENGRVGRKPIHWEYQDNPNRKRLYQIYGALAKLKKEEVAFESTDFTLQTASALKKIKINHSDMDVRIIGNFDVVDGTINPEFSVAGTWYEYFSGQQIEVSSTNEPIRLKPGEYRIYTTKQLSTPQVITAPEANNVIVSGTSTEEQTLTAEYDYSDVDNDLEGNSIYKWHRANSTNGNASDYEEVIVTGANTKTYVLTAADRNKFVRFSVTPVAQTGELLTGRTVYSTYSNQVVSIGNPPIAQNVIVSGLVNVGEILTGEYIFSDNESDQQGTSIFEWYRAEDRTGRNENSIAGASNTTYTLTDDDAGLYIRFSVTPVALTGSNLQGDKVYSPYTNQVTIATGIDDILKKELRLYPNPVRDILHLENLKQVEDLYLYNLSGKAIMALNSPNQNVDLNLNSLTKGIYILVFVLEDGSKLSKKIVKQ